MPASTVNPQTSSSLLLAPTTLLALCLLLLMSVLIIAYLLMVVRSLRAKNSTLQQSISHQELWTAYLSHELRNSLFVLNMQLEFLKLDCREVPNLELHIDVAKAASENLLSLVNDISDSAQIRSGSFSLNPQPTNIAQLTRSVFDSYKPLATEKALGMYISIATDAHQFVDADPKRLYQVLANLVSNAIKYTQTGEITVLIECAKGAANQDGIAVSVKDTGIGISADVQQKIFEPYYKVDSSFDETRVRHKLNNGHEDEHDEDQGPRTNLSSGLGLAIVKSIAQASGWEITLHSNETNRESGSTFKLLIPINAPLVSN